MHPLDHAISSQKAHGGAVADYLPLHSWFDASKATLCHFTHRALRHHLEGIATARIRFGDRIALTGGGSVATEDLGHQHLREDCRQVPRAADWLELLKAPDWLPSEVPSPLEIATALAPRMEAEAADLLPLCKWMGETAAWFGDTRHLAMRHHAFGIFEAEERFGIAITTAGGTLLPTRYVAERHVRHVVGRLPSATDWLRRIQGQLWMAEPTKRRTPGPRPAAALQAAIGPA